MAEIPSKANLLAEVKDRIQGEALVLKFDFSADADPEDPDHILIPEVVMGEGTEGNQPLQKLRALGGLPVIVITDSSQRRNSEPIIEAEVKPIDSRFSSDESLFLKVGQVLPSWQRKPVALPLPKALPGGHSFVLPDLSRAELYNPTGVIFHRGPSGDHILLGRDLSGINENVLLIVDDPEGRFLHIAPLSLPERWREVVRNGRLISPEDIAEEKPQEIPPELALLASRIMDTALPVFDELWDKVESFPAQIITRVDGSRKIREAVRQVVCSIEATQVPVDVRLLPREIELKFPRFNLPEFVKQYQQGNIQLKNCFASEEGKNTYLSLRITVERLPGDNKARMQVTPEITRWDEGLMQEVDAWQYLGFYSKAGKRERDLAKANLTDTLNNPYFLAALFGNLQSAETGPVEASVTYSPKKTPPPQKNHRWHGKLPAAEWDRRKQEERRVLDLLEEISKSRNP